MTMKMAYLHRKITVGTVKLPFNACHGDETFLADYHRHVPAIEKVSYCVDGFS
jgi:hypothetical protein